MSGRKPILEKGTPEKEISSVLDIPLRTLYDWRDSKRFPLYWVLRAIPREKMEIYLEDGKKMKEEFDERRADSLSGKPEKPEKKNKD